MLKQHLSNWQQEVCLCSVLVQWDCAAGREKGYGQTEQTNKHKDKLNKNNPQKLWQSLKQLGAIQNNKDTCSKIGLNIDGVVTFDKTEVATNFNNFFTTIASTLVNKLPNPLDIFGKNNAKLRPVYVVFR